MMFRSVRSISSRSHFFRLTPVSNLSLPPILHHRFASTLVIAEPSTDSSSPLTPATLSTITAAKLIQSLDKSTDQHSITLLSLSPPTSQNSKSDWNHIPSQILTLPPSFHLKHPHPVAETIGDIIFTAQNKHKYTHILAPCTKFGSNVLPRAAAKLDASPITDVVDILSTDTYVRPIYAGNILVKVQNIDAQQVVQMVTVRATAFEKASVALPSLDDPTLLTKNRQEETLEYDVDTTSSTTLNQRHVAQFVHANVSKSDRPDLSSASIVISGGRGIKSADNFALLEKLADTIFTKTNIPTAIGASRAAVDAGFVRSELQVGQTGAVVAPDLYIAIGISGAIQHLSGMKDSKTIVAINTDKEAPIFQVADYGLVEDLFKAVPEMIEKL